MKSKQQFFIFLSAILGFLLCMGNPDLSAEGISDGIFLCLHTIIPALFPYLVLTNLLVCSGGAQRLGIFMGKPLSAVFGIPQMATVPLLFGCIGGYPIGAKMTAELYRSGKITKQSAEHLLSFCNNAGPAFFLGLIARLFHSGAIGGSLYGIHLLAAALCGLFFSSREKAKSGNAETNLQGGSASSAVFTDSVARAVKSMAQICGFIVFFSWLLAILGKFLPVGTVWHTAAAGLLELSSGISFLSSSGLSWRLKYILSAFFCGWGGLCVFSQTTAILRSCGLSGKTYLKGKALHGIFSAILAWPVSYLLQPAAQTGNMTDITLRHSPWPWSIFCFAMILLIFLQYNTGNSSEHVV